MLLQLRCISHYSCERKYRSAQRWITEGSPIPYLYCIGNSRSNVHNIYIHAHVLLQSTLSYSPLPFLSQQLPNLVSCCEPTQHGALHSWRYAEVSARCYPPTLIHNTLCLNSSPVLGEGPSPESIQVWGECSTEQAHYWAFGSSKEHLTVSMKFRMRSDHRFS